MKKVYVLYNPRAGSYTGETETKKLETIIKGKELVFSDITKIESYERFFESIGEKDEIIISGGDGTLSRFANDTYNFEIKNPVFYYATGTGNDFLADMGLKKGAEPFVVSQYLKNLPIVIVKGKESRFINGIGFGIDWYACEIGDKLREKGKKINYISVVIKGIVYAYKPKNLTVWVDGEKRSFKRVWFAPTMKGRFYGGGINMAPGQERSSGKVSLVVVHTAFNFVILPILPTAFKGEHIKFKKYVTVIEGEDVRVQFDKPCALQVDGETVLDVTEYSVKAGKENMQKMEKQLIL